MMRRILHIYQAEPIGPPVPELHLIADCAPPRDNLDSVRKAYRHQARVIVEGILESRPGGLVDAVLAELMRVKASLLCVPHKERTP